MRINKYVAQATGMSRRAADAVVAEGRVRVNGQPASPGHEITANDQVTLDSRAITSTVKTITIMLNKPVGYVVSRNGQGSKTIYDLLPPEYHALKPVGRLDKDSSGLLLLTNDGNLANELTHPRHQKTKVYQVTLHKPLTPAHAAQIEQGVLLEDGLSAFRCSPLESRNAHRIPNSELRPSPRYEVRLTEGRNRQIRRTFAALGYMVTTLYRTHFGPHGLGQLNIGRWQVLP